MEAFLEATVTAHEPERGVTRVALGGDGDRDEAALSIPWTPDLSEGRRVLLAVGADEVIVATARPDGLSARNAVPVTLEALDPLGEHALLARATGGWLAHLTPEAVRELDLAPGRRVWMVTKTHSWRIVA